MKIAKIAAAALAALVMLMVAIALSRGQPSTRAESEFGASMLLASEQAVRARLAEIQDAAQALDPDKVFSFVLENDNGALAQNGRLLLTRKEALESTRDGFRGLQKVEYHFDRQHVTLLSPTVALAVGEGTSSASRDDGRAFSTHFVQSVILVLTNSEWKVFHSHRSFPMTR
jgi:hypothetical protein